MRRAFSIFLLSLLAIPIAVSQEATPTPKKSTRTSSKASDEPSATATPKSKSSATPKPTPTPKKSTPIPKKAREKLPSSGLTVNELYNKAIEAYNTRNYPAASKLYWQIFQEFSASIAEPQIAELLRKCLYPRARSDYLAKKFDWALDSCAEALAATPPLAPLEREDTHIWLAMSHTAEKNYPEAQRTFLDFCTAFSKSRFFQFSSFQAAAAPFYDERYKEAATALAAAKPHLDPVNRGHAATFEIASLLETDQHDTALATLLDEYPRISHIYRLVAFQKQTLRLADIFLDAARYQDAIQCLQRVWTQTRILRTQTTLAEKLETQIASTADPFTKATIQGDLAEVKKEIATFSAEKNFDSATRFRLAAAYLELERYREAALVMEGMLEDIPPDKTVEDASTALVQVWSQIECWERVITAAEKFEAAFPGTKNIPLVLYLCGVAEQKLLRYDAAIATFTRIATDYKKSDTAPRAVFQTGFTHLLAEDNPAAIEALDSLLEKFSKHELADSAEYWRGMASSFDKEYETAHEALGDYLKNRKKGIYRDAAAFRCAYCLQQLLRFPEAITALNKFIKEYPNSEHIPEAYMLLGDAYLDQAKSEEGLAAYAAIPPDARSFYEEGIFKMVKISKLLDDDDSQLALLRKFINENPRSARVTEAVSIIGKIQIKHGDPKKARKTYWDAITKYGSDPAARAVDDLFPHLIKLYRAPGEPEQYAALARDLRHQANSTLTTRSLWAEGLAYKKADPVAAEKLFIEAATHLDPSTANPLILADIAETLEKNGKKKEAETLWLNLVKWNPRAPQKDRALAALGFISLDKGNEKEALEYFDRFERETTSSILLPKIMTAHATLQIKRGDYTAARTSLDTLLASPAASGLQKATALCQIGDTYIKEKNPSLAIPYYQRTFVMHSRWRDQTAHAYLQSAQAFETLGDTEAARRTYTELTEKSDLADFPETATAKKKLTDMNQ